MRFPNTNRAPCFFGLTLLLAGGLVFGGCMSAPEPEGPHLSFLKGRKRWQSADVELSLAEAGGEKTLTLVVRRPETGESLTLLVVTPELQGRHDLRVFGSLADRDSHGEERLFAISNVCSGDASGSLTFEILDADQRTLGGSFIANVCGLEDPDRTWTLADGKFRNLSYPKTD